MPASSPFPVQFSDAELYGMNSRELRRNFNCGGLRVKGNSAKEYEPQGITGRFDRLVKLLRNLKVLGIREEYLFADFIKNFFSNFMKSNTLRKPKNL